MAKLHGQKPLNKEKLFKAIHESFDKAELKHVCFELAINYDDLDGESLLSKIQSLIEYSYRRNTLEHLVEKLSEKRPHNFEFAGDDEYISSLRQEFLLDVKSPHANSEKSNTSISIIGNQNNIHNINLTVQYFGQLLGQDTNNLLTKLAEAQTQLSKELHPDNKSNNTEDLYKILAQVLDDEGLTNKLDLLSEISNWVAPIIENYRNFRYRHEFPFGSFCHELLKAFSNHPSIKLALVTESIVKENKIPLSSLTAVFPLPGSLQKRFQTMDRGLPYSFFLSSIERNGVHNLLLQHNGNPMITEWSVQFKPREIRYIESGFAQNTYHLVMNFQNFSAFILGLVSDFALILRRVETDNQDFSLKMVQLFETFNIKWDE